MRLLTLALILAAAPAAAEAPRFLKRDAACEPVAKLQFLDCEVDVVYRCPAVDGTKGPLWREETYGPDGLSDISTSTSDGLMLEDVATDGSIFTTSTPAQHKATPFAEVLATGKGAFSQKMSVMLMGKAGKGKMALNVADKGETVTLGGLTARVFTGTQQVELPDPVGKIQSTFLVYLFPDSGMVISGERLSGTLYRPDAPPHRPIALSLPGADDFVKTTPAFCGGKSS